MPIVDQDKYPLIYCYFYWKIVKIVKRWSSAPRSTCLWRLWALTQTHTLVILHCEFFHLHVPTPTDSFEIDQRHYVLVIIAGVPQAFGG